VAAKATAAMTTVRRIDNVAERFMGQLSFFVGRAVFECFSTSDGSPSDGGARARVERDRADGTVQNPYGADPRCWWLYGFRQPLDGGPVEAGRNQKGPPGR